MTTTAKTTTRRPTTKPHTPLGTRILLGAIAACSAILVSFAMYPAISAASSFTDVSVGDLVNAAKIVADPYDRVDAVPAEVWMRAADLTMDDASDAGCFNPAEWSELRKVAKRKATGAQRGDVLGARDRMAWLRGYCEFHISTPSGRLGAAARYLDAANAHPSGAL